MKHMITCHTDLDEANESSLYIYIGQDDGVKEPLRWYAKASAIHCATKLRAVDILIAARIFWLHHGQIVRLSRGTFSEEKASSS